MSPPQSTESRHATSLGRREFLEATGTAGLALSVTGCLSRFRDTAVEISDWHDLVGIKDGLDQQYVMTDDLGPDTDGYVERGAGPGGDWDPIGNTMVAFTGTLDGDGHVITGLTVDRPLHQSTGLFGGASSSTIKQLGLGTPSNPVTISGGRVTGGLVGRNEGEIRRCHVIGEVSGTDTVGGLVGDGDNPAEVAECYVAGTVSGEVVVGGLVGVNADIVTESCVTGEVIGERTVGGLVGTNDVSLGDIADTYATATVSGATSVGGLVGASGRGDIERSYAAGTVTGEEAVGGVIGERAVEYGEAGDLSGVYWDRTATGQPTAVGEGETTDASVAGFGDVSETGPAPAMRGEQARENMAKLSFGEEWRVVTDPPEYPELTSVSIDGDSSQ